MDVSGCHHVDGFTLLYTGISPKQPPRNGRPARKGQLRQRIVTHYAGNAEGSTLRKTLGCLLAGELGIQLRRVRVGFPQDLRRERAAFALTQVRRDAATSANALPVVPNPGVGGR